MIDIHAHTIPMVDDGPRSFEESIEFLKLAVDNGIDQMIATPHYYSPKYVNRSVLPNYEKLLDHIKTAELSIILHLGNELYLSEEGVKDLIKGYVNTLAGSNYVLIELPVYQFYPFHEDLIFRMQLEGFKVILAHVERYHIFRKNPEKLKQLIERGVFTQMNCSCITNRETRHIAYELINTKRVHVIASDGHDLLERQPTLKITYDMITNKFGKETAEVLYQENPLLIIKNAPNLFEA